MHFLSSPIIPDEIQERILSNKKLDDNDTKDHFEDRPNVTGAISGDLKH